MLAKNDKKNFPKKLLHNQIKFVTKSELSKQLVTTSDYRKRHSSMESYQKAQALIHEEELGRSVAERNSVSVESLNEKTPFSFA